MLSGATFRNGHAYVLLPTGLSELESFLLARTFLPTWLVAPEQVLSISILHSENSGASILAKST